VRVVFLKLARQELREAMDYYDGERAGLGRELLAEVRAAIDRIKSFPTAWQPISANTRRCITRRFPYGVIYRLRDGDILILAVAHLHRNPEHWQDRLLA
jgi:plasmid stabilization system protein ParE